MGDFTPDDRSIEEPSISDTQALFRFILFPFV